jgi:MarR family transcriptional regulator, temperature-dependent positive regulator of motility
MSDRAATGPGSGQARDPNLSLAHLLHRAQQAATDLHLRKVGPDGLTQRQLAVLSALAAQETSCSQTDLVQRTGVDRSTMADLVTRLARRGLVAREKSAADSRANAVTLTEAGQATLEAASGVLSDVDTELLARLPRKQRDGFLHLLASIALPGDQADGSDPRRSGKDKPRKKDKKDRKKGKAKRAKAARLLESANAGPSPAS